MEQNDQHFTRAWPYNANCAQCGRRASVEGALVLVRHVFHTPTDVYCLGRKGCVSAAHEAFRRHKETTSAWIWPSWPQYEPVRFRFVEDKAAISG